MTAGDVRPLLFLDVDGPLIPIGGAPPISEGRTAWAGTTADAWDGSSNPLLSRLNPTHGKRLTALGCELVWATTWMADANEEVAPRIGLPQLAVVDWPEAEEQAIHGLHWKTEALVAWAAGRPFVWVDDEVSEADRAWVAANHPGHALLHRVDPRVGLSDPDFAAIERWLARYALPAQEIV